jgi:hypothetical protein
MVITSFDEQYKKMFVIISPSNET